MPGCTEMHEKTTLALPNPRLAEGRFGSCSVFTDEALFEACGVRIAFTERLGGASFAPYDSLNLGGHVGDDADAVSLNRALVMEALGASGSVLVQPRQVHGIEVVTVRTLSDAQDLASQEFEADGVAVGCADVAALLCFADCVPVIGAAPDGSFFVAHAGWRGVAGRIVERSIERLCSLAECPPSMVNLYIGPYIHACHFEVGPEVRARFEDEFGRACIADERHVDLGAALRQSMYAAGAAPDRIADAGVCTVCDGGSRFYSYRASGGVCGRHGAIAVRISSGH